MTESALSILIVIFSVQLQQTEISDRKLFIFQQAMEKVLLFEVGDGRCISDLRNYIGELWRRRKQLMS